MRKSFTILLATLSGIVLSLTVIALEKEFTGSINRTAITMIKIV